MPLADPALITAPSRLAALRATGLLDQPPNEAFDRLTHVASRILKAPVALVSLVDADRQFFASQVGLAEPWASDRETPLTHSFCQHVVATGRPFVVAHAKDSPLVADNLAIPDLGVIAYAGIPLTTFDGQTLGSFCAIDTVRREWTYDELDLLDVLAQAAMREVELRTIVAEMQRVSRFKDQMLGFASHELRTPLNGIMGALQIIEMELPEGADRRMVDLGLASSRRLLRLINDLLNVEQLESGAIAMQRSDQKADALIGAAADAVRTSATELGVTVDVRRAGVSVYADPDRIVQVIVNLLGNALKFAPRGSHISVEAVRDGMMVRFTVRDRGRGVPDSHKERIFERFQQVEASDKHEKGGAGLGLAICRAIITQHGGRIWVENPPLGEAGSVFAFTLPSAPS